MADRYSRYDDLIDAVPWARLAHAYGFADDVPRTLRALVAATSGISLAEPPGFDGWMFSTVVHQGVTAYSATAPILWLCRRIVADLPDHESVDTCLLAVARSADIVEWARARAREGGQSDGPEPERSPEQGPLWASFVAAEAAVPSGRADYDDKGLQVYSDAARVDLRTLGACVEDWRDTVIAYLSSRRCPESALDAAGALLRMNPHAPLVAALQAVLDDWPEDEFRSAAAFALCASDLDASVHAALIGHPDRPVRVAAALATPDHPDGLASLVDALTEADWVDRTFPRGLIGAEPSLRAALVQVTLERLDFASADERLIRGLEQQLATRKLGPMEATYEWGKVMAWAFADRRRPTSYVDLPDPAGIDDSQRRLLAALVANDGPWTRRCGNSALALGQIGLPHDRAVVAKVAGVSRRRFPWRGR